MDTALITKGVIMPHWPTGAITTLLCIFFLLPPYFTSLHGMLRTSAKDYYPLRLNDDVQISDELCGEIYKPVIDVKKIEDLLNEVRYWHNRGLKKAKHHLAQPLKAAIRTKNLRILDSLILAGGDVNKSGLLHAAVRYKNPAAIDYLIAHGADINKREYLSGTPLHEAVSFTIVTSDYDTATMLTLLKHHPNTSAPDPHMNDNTALYQATRDKNLEAMQLLLAHGARHTDKNNIGNTPLMALQDDFDILMQDPEDPNYWSRVFSRTNSICEICEKPAIGIHQVENAAFMLLAYGADPNEFLQGKPLEHEHRNSMFDITYLKTMFDTACHADRVITGQEQPRIGHLDATHQWLFIWRLLSANKEDLVRNLELPCRTLEVEIMRNWFTSFPCPQRFYDKNSRMDEQRLYYTVMRMQPLNEFSELRQELMSEINPLLW